MRINKLFWSLSLCSILAGLVSCQKASVDVDTSMSAMASVDPTELTFPTEGESQTIELKSKVDWAIECSDSWIKASANSGTSGDRRIIITVSANPNDTPRKSVLSITSTRCTGAIDITVTQNGKNGITLNKTATSIKVGSSETLVATVIKNGSTVNDPVTWSSSNTSVATVDSNGKVTAKSIGTSTIKATANGKTASCTVTVVSSTVAVTSVTLSKTSASLKEGEKITLTATVNPSNATNKTVTWSTSNSSVATVSNGVVTAVKAGTATITAKAGDKSATCTVTIVSSTVAVTSITLSQTSVPLAVGEKNTLTATVNPSDATNKTITWSTSNSSVATVNNGIVTAVKVGTATITAKAGDKSATCTITVTSPTNYNGHEYVDLGLSVKWATMNVGATSAEKYGKYYAWGETTTKSSYDWSNYKYCKGTNKTLTKYCNDSSYGYNGFTDSKTVLDFSDDAARTNWGGGWRIPTEAEWNELSQNCTWTLTTLNGVKGCKIQSNKTGFTTKWIFLPLAGMKIDTRDISVGNWGYYWSSSLDTSYTTNAIQLCIIISDSNSYYEIRGLGMQCGRSVRAVCK